MTRINRLVLIFSSLAFGLALAVFAYTGTFARLWADDYCYEAALRADGFWKAQLTFYQQTSDRFSVIPLVGLGNLVVAQATRFWPLLALLLAVLGLAWTLRQASLRYRWRLPALERWLLAAAAVFFTFWQAPNLFQVLYWRTGMLTYFMPLVVDIFLAGLILDQTRRKKLSAWMSALVFLAALFAGGFSETTAALQAGALLLALLGIIAAAGLRRRPVTGLGLVAIALLGTLAAMIALWVSPSIRIRMAHMVGPASLPVLFRDSFRYGFDFIRDTIATQPLPTFVSILVPFCAGLAGRPTNGEKPRSCRGLLALGLALVATYLLIVSVCAPSVYVEVAYPEYRALIAARFVMVLGLAASGWLAGEILSGMLAGYGRTTRLVQIAALGLLALASLYPLRAARSLWVQDLPYYQQRAAGWDARDREIRSLAQQGQRQIQAEVLDSMFGITELQPNADQWPNNCVALSYGLDGITGVAK